jgi:hypothetical protein
MRKILFLIFVVLSCHVNAKTKFISGTEDIPLMERLQESEASAQATFSSPQGKILSTVLHGTVSPNEIFAYYNGVLPNLGWVKKGIGLYVREREKLKFEIKKYRNMVSFVEVSLVSVER